MILDRPRPGNRLRDVGRVLYQTTVPQSRSHALYATMGAPDTVEGRFELMTLHVILLVHRLKGDDPAATDLRQVLFDAYLSDLDGALREMGVGDLSVGKRMKALGAAFYGRADAFERALERLPDRSPLEELLHRTVFDGNDIGDTAALADYVLRCRAALSAAETPQFLLGHAPWPAP